MASTLYNKTDELIFHINTSILVYIVPLISHTQQYIPVVLNIGIRKSLYQSYNHKYIISQIRTYQLLQLYANHHNLHMGHLYFFPKTDLLIIYFSSY